MIPIVGEVVLLRAGFGTSDAPDCQDAPLEPSRWEGLNAATWSTAVVWRAKPLWVAAFNGLESIFGVGRLVIPL